ncbi:MAG: hypothetical protein IKV05_01040 [Bacteroidales bacterium]|nr:hypothetical protein [Bacteroidales bacterium]
MKKFFKFAAIVAAAAALFSCQEKPTPEPGDQGGTGTTELNQNIKFTLTVTNVETNSAKIEVKHNGKTTDTWYGFATTESDIEKAIEDEVAALVEEGKVTLKKSTSTTVTVRQLEADTDYTYVAFGLSVNGEVYGTPCTVEFTTKPEAIVFDSLEETEDWKLAYAGREENVEYFTVECEEESIYYFEAVSAYSIMDEEGNVYLQDYMLYTLDMIGEYLKNYSVNTLVEYEVLLQGGGTLMSGRLESGPYFLFAVGFNADGTPTGTYSAIEFEILPETPTEEYSQWLGTYNVTDQNNTTYTLTLHEYDPNFMFAVTGWECGEWLDENGMDFGTAFERQLAFPAYYQDGMLVFAESFITYLTVTNSQGNKVETELGLYGYELDGEEAVLLLTDGEYLAFAEPSEGNITVNGLNIQFDETTIVPVEALGYAAVALDYTNYFLWNAPMALPLTMVKQEVVPTSLMNVAPKSIQMNAPKFVKGSNSSAAKASLNMGAPTCKKSDLTLKKSTFKRVR